MFITLKSNLLFFGNYLYIVIYTYSNLQKKKENKCTLLIYVHKVLKERRKVSGDGSPLPFSLDSVPDLMYHHPGLRWLCSVVNVEKALRSIRLQIIHI